MSRAVSVECANPVENRWKIDTIRTLKFLGTYLADCVIASWPLV